MRITDSQRKVLVDFIGTAEGLKARARYFSVQCIEYHDLDGSQKWSNVAADAGSLVDSLSVALAHDREAISGKIEKGESA